MDRPLPSPTPDVESVPPMPKISAVRPLAPQPHPARRAMDDSVVPFPEPYAKLSVRSADIFPMTCTRCQRRFTDIHDFIARTTPIFHSSGLMEREDPAIGTFVLLLRNCLCGTSLALRCTDRRDNSERGQLRRNRYDTLVGLLVEVGVEVGQAQREIRRVLDAAAS